MPIDFAVLEKGEVALLEFSNQFTVEDMRLATNASVDYLLGYIRPASDAAVAFIPEDPVADDPYAVEGERTIGWSLAHLVLHVTASSEEGAAFSSILARGIPIGGRLRYEPDWKTFTTRDQCLTRLEESRRMRLAYLDTWPDNPHLDVFRRLPKESPWHQQVNAKAAFILGLRHEVNHYAQFADVAAQARAALARGSGGGQR
ncbi:MAG: DinB family protein [Chloroflexi bacterium]|nr:DinB family protein [Chloroflexota bacterium]